MLEAFIITLREGVEAALIVGITLVYLAKIGRNDLRKAVYAALGGAFLGSITARIGMKMFLKAGSCWQPPSSSSPWWFS